MRKLGIVLFVSVSFTCQAMAVPQALYSVDAPNETLEIRSKNYLELPPIVDCAAIQDAARRAECTNPMLLSPTQTKRAVIATGLVAHKVCSLGLQVAYEEVYSAQRGASFNDYVFYDPSGLTRRIHHEFVHIARVTDTSAEKTTRLVLWPGQPPVPVYVDDFTGSSANFVWFMAVPARLNDELQKGFSDLPGDEKPPYRRYQYIVANTRHPTISFSLGLVKNQSPLSLSKDRPLLYDAANSSVVKDGEQMRSEIIEVDGVAYMRAMAQFEPFVVLFAFADYGKLDVLCWSKLKS